MSKAAEKKIAVLVRLFESDLDRLQRFYPKQPYNMVIRVLVRKHLDALEKKIEKSSPITNLPKEI